MKIETENIIKVKFTKNGLLMIICEESIKLFAIKFNNKMYE